ncbi:MFS transporter [Fervidobacterium nodosum]|uniref:Major facilitator superfamily MFS_1 n=1 Tax=Fervidobacterium nodosum (strain ATCC 35602 / DSM 5306 / Rt17-B1) TaxID=381764 RepID=A7HKM0_FERNB|nr:MFS transporter [Fervidobacterium nodosum]ABS60453.1 major facilitator superfamily MFS_1 [Fervidobacterium nodosum Rt17-B1]PHJ14559.1 MFS transporter [Fervidobacterium sp. SC_NGM5_G05]
MVSESIYKHEKRNLALIISGRFESLIGASALMIAMPLYVLDLTGSGTIMGIFSMLGILPRLITNPIGGVLGDRINRKWIMVGLDELRGLLLIFMGWLALMNKLSIVNLLLFRALLSVMDGLFDGPTAAMFGDVVRKENMKTATSLNSMAGAVSNIIGPILGGVLYGVYGFKNVIFMTAVLYILSGISELFIIYKFQLSKSEKLEFFKELGEGVRFVVQNKGLKFLFTFAIVINFLTSPLLSVVLPYIMRVKIGFSSTQFGTLEVFATVGALLGNILLVSIFRKSSSKQMIWLGLIAQGMVLIALSILIMPYFGFSKSILYMLFGVGFFLVGLFNIIINVPINANLQILTPSELRSRVFSVLNTIAMGTVPISSALYGFLIDKIDPFWFFLAINVISMIVVLIFLLKAPEEAYVPSNLPNTSTVSSNV